LKNINQQTSPTKIKKSHINIEQWILFDIEFRESQYQGYLELSAFVEDDCRSQQ
jgi:hypothetical protein